MRLIHYTYPTQRRFFSTTAFPRTPWGGLETEIGRLFDSALSTSDRASRQGAFPVDLYEDKANTYVRAELPGIDREAIQVEVVDGQLNIQAAFKTTEGENAETSSFNRSVALSDDVQTDKVSAQYENGILTVTLPKKEEVQPKKITVQVS